MAIRVFTTAIALGLLLTAQVAAQSFPVVPDPTLCTLDPRTIAEVEALVEASTAEPLQPTPSTVPVPFVMPDGFSLVEDEQREIEKDLVRAIACVNTGDPLKVFATYTDRYVVELIERLGGLSDVVVSGLLTVRQLPESDRLHLVSIDEAILLHDGRALVIVTGDNPVDDLPAGPRAFYLEEVLPGRWLVDEVLEIELSE